MSEPDDRVSLEIAPPSDRAPSGPHPRLPRVAIVLASAFFAGLVVALWSVGARVGALEARELEAVSAFVTAQGDSGRAPILSAHLRRDDEVVFEVCSSSQLEPSSWGGALSVAIVHLTDAGPQDVVRSPLDAELLVGARRSSTLTCLNAGQGVIEVDGTYVTASRGPPPCPRSPPAFGPAPWPGGRSARPIAISSSRSWCSPCC